MHRKIRLDTSQLVFDKETQSYSDPPPRGEKFSAKPPEIDPQELAIYNRTFELGGLVPVKAHWVFSHFVVDGLK